MLGTLRLQALRIALVRSNLAVHGSREHSSYTPMTVYLPNTSAKREFMSPESLQQAGLAHGPKSVLPVTLRKVLSPLAGDEMEASG